MCVNNGNSFVLLKVKESFEIFKCSPGKNIFFGTNFCSLFTYTAYKRSTLRLNPLVHTLKQYAHTKGVIYMGFVSMLSINIKQMFTVDAVLKRPEKWGVIFTDVEASKFL